MLAHAFPTVLAVKARPRPAPERVGIADPDEVAISTLIPLTRNEIRRLFTGIHTLARDIQHRLHWSNWRRHHQAVARASHYKRREAAIT